jgi:aspartate carbamoyltransferase catalytic subunit
VTTSLHSIISTAQLQRDLAESLISSAQTFNVEFTKYGHLSPFLKNKVIVNAFFENSTRTRVSFEFAALRLGASVVNFSSQGSSTAKGESYFDTLQTIDSLSPDVIVIRHPMSGASEFATTWTSAHILNAGDGKHEHPSQALLDAMTLYQKFGSIDNKRIGIVGDILHSRVARSNITLLKTLGAKIMVCAPPTLLPRSIDTWGVEVAENVKEIIEHCSAVMTLRLQLERMQSGLLPSLGEYTKRYGLTSALLSTNKDIAILHPGPVNYGVEIDFDVANSSQSLIRNQVTNGMFMRMAMLCHVAGE